MQFPEISMQALDGASRCWGAQVECCKCEKVEQFRKPRAAGQHAVEKHFENKGWYIGPSRARDICPDCQVKKKKESTPLRVISSNSETTPVAVVPPREMGREDRRVIFSKLEEHYIGEKEGYADGWHDVRIATDLGVPVQWVEKMRDENFGPVKSNASFDEFLKKAEDLRKETADFKRRFDQFVIDAKSIGDRTVELLSQADKIRKTLGR